MSRKLSSIFWGIILIALGIYAFAQTMGYRPSQDPTMWAIVFGGISLVALVLYIVDGWQHWGWLFPVGIFGALSALLFMARAGVDDPAMAAPLFLGIGLPFIVAFFMDRVKNWWALIPAGVMAFLILVLLVVNRLPGEIIGAGFLFIMAVAFFLVYWSQRRLWAAIVAYVFFVLGFMPLLAMTPYPEFAGPVFLLATGLPFLYVYARSPQNWWAIIPAGTLLALAAITGAALVVAKSPSIPFFRNIFNFILFAGLALTFAVVWLRHHQPWALFVTAVMAVAAIVSLFVAKIELVWPVLIILAGIFLLVRNLRPKRVEG